MKKGKIMIVGPIGSFQLDGEEVKGIELLDVVTKVMALDPEVTDIVFQYDTPGGREDVGNNIYDYIMSLKPRYKIISEQIGMVASIGTKLWFTGDVRIATKGEKFMIHNPWIPRLSGDADTVAAVAAQMKAVENNLKSFYMLQTGITEEGIAPLMKAETAFGDEQAVELKFATELQSALKIAAYMKNETKEKFLAFFKGLEKFFSDDVLNLVAETEDGKKIAFAVEDPAQIATGVPAMMTDAQGNPTQTPAPDGTYKLKDGRTVAIAQGKVTTVTGGPTPAPAPAPTPPPAPDEQAMVVALDKAVLAFEKGKNKLKDEIMASVKEEFKTLRGEIKGSHKPAKYQEADNATLVLAWDKSMKDKTNGEIRKQEPEKWALMFFAKYGRMPNT